MTEAVIVDLLRHGEVAAEGWAFRGRTDVALSEQGWQQMQSISQALQQEEIAMAQVASSPLQRCRLFARQTADAFACPLQVLTDMREMDFGHWEGQSFERIQQQDSALLQRFWHNPVGVQPPAGECFDDFARRVIACWHEWLCDDSGEHRLLVAHGGVLRVLLAHLLRMPMDALWRFHLPYAAWCRVSLLQGAEPRLMFINRLA